MPEQPYLSLTSSEEFSKQVSRLDAGAQLSFCEDLFTSHASVEAQSGKIVLQAWEWIIQNKLYSTIGKTKSQYKNHVESAYEILPIVRSERRKQKAYSTIQKIWKKPLRDCFPSELSEPLSRNLLEELVKFAQTCSDFKVAKKLLEESKNSRPRHSSKTKFIIVADVQRGRELYLKGQERRRRSKKRSDQKKSDTQRQQRTPKSKAPIGSPETTHVDSSEILEGRLSKSTSPEVHDTAISSPESHDAATSSPEVHDTAISSPESHDTAISSPQSELVSTTADFDESLLDFLPISLVDFHDRLRLELDRLLQNAPRDTWGEQSLKQMSKLHGMAEPAQIYVKGVPNAISHGIYTTASREQAQVLSLTDEDAREALIDGPKDGSRVLIRNSKDHRAWKPKDFLDRIVRYRRHNSPLDVQDPLLQNSDNSHLSMTLDKIIPKLRRVLNGETVGYEGHQVSPYNLLSLPSLCRGEPDCLSDETTQIHDLIRRFNPPKPGDGRAEGTAWGLLASHMAITLPHQDHDGFGTWFYDLFGYKVIYFWPDSSDRAKFLQDGMLFAEHGLRYLVLGPGDQYIQTPCQSLDIHAVVSVGYCGVTECVEECEEGSPCCGLVGMDGRHYWHAHYMDHTTQSALEELEETSITNEPPRHDFVKNLEIIADLAGNTPNLLGGDDATSRFMAARKVCCCPIK